MRRFLLLFLLLAATAVSASEPARVQTLKITVLSTMLADGYELGEWGFAALVEADGHRLLYDTGARPDTVLQNANSLGISLADIEDVVLSHHHDDHIGGLAQLRASLRSQNERALIRAHVASQIFWPRFDRGKEDTAFSEAKTSYEAAGGRFVIHESPAELYPGVWLTG